MRPRLSHFNSGIVVEARHTKQHDRDQVALDGRTCVGVY